MPRPLLHDQTTTMPYCMIKLQLIIWISLWDHLDQYLVQNYKHISSRWKETLESLRAMTRRQRRCHKCCMFHEAKQKLCTSFTCLFHFCTFLSRSRQICDVKWPFFKFCREREYMAGNLNFLPWLLHHTSKFSSWVVPLAFEFT